MNHTRKINTTKNQTNKHKTFFHNQKQYKLKRCSNKNDINNEERSSLMAPEQNGPYKNKHITKHTEQQDVTDIQNKL